MRSEPLVESVGHVVTLTESEAAGLRRAGRELASRSGWWGERDEQRERTVIRCEHQAGSKYRVTVADAVGVVAIGDLQLIVQPKIPTAHFLHLLSAAGAAPRLASQRAAVDSGESFWELVATWYVDALERLIQSGLMRDYRPESDELNLVRGRVIPADTARALYSGRVEITCSYEEFDTDTSLNRVLLSAARVVTASPLLNGDLRARARRSALRMDGVGDVRPGDLEAGVERRTGRYTDALSLARTILRDQARTLSPGTETAWTFLIPTPKLVEAGLRVLLAAELGDHWELEPRRFYVGPGTTLNPDIVINNGEAVLDVKYKLSEADWRRSDLYEIVTFAEGLGATRSAIIDFATDNSVAPRLQIGSISAINMTWDARAGSEPAAAVQELAAQLGAWLEKTEARMEAA